MADGTILTPTVLRDHAAAPRTPEWEHRARMLLEWAADLIDAAETIRREEKGGGNGHTD